MELINPRVRSMVRASLDDPEAFWAAAAELLPWFQGARTNLAYNCIDRHVERGWGGHAALVYENERGERRVLTYAQLMHEVKGVAAALRALGIGRGDRVGVYMPTCPEAIAVMLACARIGAIHLVVFAGFGAGALGDRIDMAEAKAVLTADVTWRKGKEVRLKEIVDAALQGSRGTVQKAVVLRRSAAECPASTGTSLTLRRWSTRAWRTCAWWFPRSRTRCCAEPTTRPCSPTPARSGRRPR